MCRNFKVRLPFGVRQSQTQLTMQTRVTGNNGRLYLDMYRPPEGPALTNFLILREYPTENIHADEIFVRKKISEILLWLDTHQSYSQTNKD